MHVLVRRARMASVVGDLTGCVAALNGRNGDDLALRQSWFVRAELACKACILSPCRGNWQMRSVSKLLAVISKHGACLSHPNVKSRQ